MRLQHLCCIAEGAEDYAVNFAQTDPAGWKLSGRHGEADPDFSMVGSDRESKVLGGRKGGMPQMVFEYILEKKRH